MATLLRALVDASGLSRRRAFAAIREGRVSVDGRPCRDPSAPYGGGEIVLDGAPLSAQRAERAYLLLNKPPGYVTTRADERGRRTVFDLVPAELEAPGLHSVGRLDRDTSGLLILTNDGDLTFALTHPRHEVDKEYFVRLAQPASEDQIARLRSGVEIDGRMTRPARLRRLVGAGPFQLSITVREGRKRQVRRMFEAVGARVTGLRRVREGPLELGGLPEGSVRRLTAEEVEALRRAAGAG
ncbi:MAG TPA: pseudouridine synthase [Dehalococcoidia bacterium]|nr:pseudouridine synthase [Dehalococcoidia bacterium]